MLKTIQMEKSILDAKFNLIQINKNLAIDGKIFLDRNFNIVLEFKSDEFDDPILKIFTKYFDFFDIVAICDVVIQEFPSYGYKRLLKCRFLDYNTDKYEEKQVD